MRAGDKISSNTSVFLCPEGVFRVAERIFMKGFLLFWAAVLLLMLGHCFKMIRWKQFIEVYEKPRRQSLMRALVIGYTINFFIPLRMGDLVRSVCAGRGLKNGTGFSLATVVVDRYLDILSVGLIFLVLSLTDPFAPEGRDSVLFYLALSGILLAASSLAIRASSRIKQAAKWFASLFNARIELSILFFLWSAITAFKDIFQRLNKKRLVLTTALMWGFYLLSYYTMSLFITRLGYTLTFPDVFLALFSRSNLGMAAICAPSFWKRSGMAELYLSLYIALPLLLLLILSFVPHSFWARMDRLAGKSGAEPSALQLLPQVHEKDRLRFLEQYFSSGSREYLQKYIELNRSVHILQDYSAGSNATTMLCMDEKRMFYRKYAFGRDGGKLYEQIEWLRAQQGTLPLPKILRVQHSEDFCSYDMAFDETASGLFQLIHSGEPDRVWGILRTALDDLSAHLHSQNVRPASAQAVGRYMDQKVRGNLEKMEAARELRPLLAFETLTINGKVYRNLPLLRRWLRPEFLREIFIRDVYAEIHGDLTVENIICRDAAAGTPYYFIDPNTGNLHESPALDYTKLLQSLHGGYEFFMRTRQVKVQNDHINFLFTRSQGYGEIFSRYRSYLEEKFSRDQVRSIFFHEIVHWLRLMPYKIENCGKRAVLFYAGLIMVFNDVVDWYAEPDGACENPARVYAQTDQKEGGGS